MWTDWLLIGAAVLAVYLLARSAWLFWLDVYRGERP